MSLQRHVELGRKGLMLVLSSPSGAGKTTLSRRLLDRYTNAGPHESMVMSISVTTREPRPGETDGEDYFFINDKQYLDMVADNKLLEYARVFNHHYGTPAEFVTSHIDNGTDVLFDIDWQGTAQLKHKNPKDLVSIFILPPSLDELERRLRARAQDSEEVMRMRMLKATTEISHWPEYDYVLINQDLDETLDRINHILVAERLKRNRQRGLKEFVHSL